MRATIIKMALGCLLLGWVTMTQASEERAVSNLPSTYTVQKGDTLWDIAGQFLKHPQEWEALWENSTGIQNPHLIYPGDVVTLASDAHNQPQLSIERGLSRVDGHLSDEKAYKLSPRVRIYPAKKARYKIPLNKIEPFFSRSKILPEGVIDEASSIFAVGEGHLLVTQGNRFYVKDLAAQPGDVLGIYRVGKALKHPKTGAFLGRQVDYLGKAEVEQKNDHITSLILLSAEGEIRPGAKLLPLEKKRLEPYLIPKTPKKQALGFILSVLNGINQIGQNQVITLSGGKDIGREEGDLLAVYQRKKDILARVKRQQSFEKKLDKEQQNTDTHFAPVEVGKVIVFKVFDKASLALVTDAHRPIYLHDEVRRP